MTDRLATILFVGAIGIIALVCGTVLIVKGHPAEALVGLAGTALGVLAPSPLSKTATSVDPLPVQVENQPADPVPVEPA